MTASGDDAKAIYQHNLDIVTKAMMEDDFDTVLSHLAVPAYICSSDQQIFVETREHLHRILLSSRQWLHDLKVDTYVRVCRGAEFVTANCDYIVGEHETFALRKGLPIIPAYRSTMAFVHQDGRWLAGGITANVRDRDFPITRDDAADYSVTASKHV